MTASSTCTAQLLVLGSGLGLVLQRHVDRSPVHTCPQQGANGDDTLRARFSAIANGQDPTSCHDGVFSTAVLGLDF